MKSSGDLSLESNTVPTSLAEDRLLSNARNQSRAYGQCSQMLPKTLEHILIRFLPLVLCCLILATTPFANGQSTFGSVRGAVQDATGAGIPGAQIVLHSTDENTDRKVVSDASGDFTFENVKAGHYSLRAHRDGFADTLVDGVTVEARQDLRLSATLKVAEQSTIVEVNSGADQINTENATISDSKTNIEMTQLPLNNRATTTSPPPAHPTSHRGNSCRRPTHGTAPAARPRSSGCCPRNKTACTRCGRPESHPSSRRTPDRPTHRGSPAIGPACGDIPPVTRR